MNKKTSLLIKSINKFSDNALRTEGLNALLDVLINAESVVSKTDPDFKLIKSPNLNELKSMLLKPNLTSQHLESIGKIIANCFVKINYIKKGLNNIMEVSGQ